MPLMYTTFVMLWESIYIVVYSKRVYQPLKVGMDLDFSFEIVDHSGTLGISVSTYYVFGLLQVSSF